MDHATAIDNTQRSMVIVFLQLKHSHAHSIVTFCLLDFAIELVTLSLPYYSPRCINKHGDGFKMCLLISVYQLNECFFYLKHDKSLELVICNIAM